MTIEELKRFEKYYLPDGKISPDDFEYISASFQDRIQRFKETDHGAEMTYDIRDYFRMYTCCYEIDSKDREYFFSARYRCLKYKPEQFKTQYVDFSNTLFNPQGDELAHTVKVGKYTFLSRTPFEYNFLVLLLKWSDEKMRLGEFPVDNQIAASPVVISEEIQSQFGLDVDLDCRVPLTVGYGEYIRLDRQHVLPERPICGGLCFYIAEHFASCVSIKELRESHGILKPRPHLAVFESPYLPRHGYGGKYGRVCAFPSANEILGDESELTIYVIPDKYHQDEILKLKLFTLKDYYSVAAWLIIALFSYYGFTDPFQVEKYWPSCPILAQKTNRTKSDGNSCTKFEDSNSIRDIEDDLLNKEIEKQASRIQLLDTAINAIKIKDYKTMCDLLIKAYEPQNSVEMYNWGVMFFKGLGVQQDIDRAIKWLEKAAENEYKSAQRILGDLYYMGELVPENIPLAMELFQKASDAGDPQSKEVLDLIASNSEKIRITLS